LKGISEQYHFEISKDSPAINGTHAEFGESAQNSSRELGCADLKQGNCKALFYKKNGIFFCI
jgi:hypothetical protein